MADAYRDNLTFYHEGNKGSPPFLLLSMLHDLFATWSPLSDPVKKKVSFIVHPNQEFSKLPEFLHKTLKKFYFKKKTKKVSMP